MDVGGGARRLGRGIGFGVREIGSRPVHVCWLVAFRFQQEGVMVCACCVYVKIQKRWKSGMDRGKSKWMKWKSKS